MPSSSAVTLSSSVYTASPCSCWFSASQPRKEHLAQENHHDPEAPQILPLPWQMQHWCSLQSFILSEFLPAYSLRPLLLFSSTFLHGLIFQDFHWQCKASCPHNSVLPVNRSSAAKIIPEYDKPELLRLIRGA